MADRLKHWCYIPARQVRLLLSSPFLKGIFYGG